MRGQIVPAVGEAAGKIDHVLVILVENQTYDRIFADFPGGDGDRNQKVITADRPSWMPGFLPTHGMPSWRLRRVVARWLFKGKFAPATRSLYYDWARNFVLFDRHRSKQAASTPNHLSRYTPISLGLRNNPKTSKALIYAQAVLGLEPPDLQPPYGAKTFPTVLDNAGISWGSYGDIGITYFNELRDPENLGAARNNYTTQQYFDDAAAGNLPQVTWIFPENDDEQGGASAMEWTGKVIHALNKAPGDLWNRTAVFWFPDDWGGFYDHVQPVAGETPAAYEAGGRVPMLMMSPWAKKGTVCHEPTTHVSVMSFMEKLWGLQPINEVDAQSNDLMSNFDWNQQPLPAPKTSVSQVDIAELDTWVAANTPAPKVSFFRRLLLRVKLSTTAVFGRLLCRATPQGPQVLVGPQVQAETASSAPPSL